MEITGENWNNPGKKTFPAAALSTTNPTRSGLVFSPDLHGERLAWLISAYSIIVFVSGEGKRSRKITISRRSISTEYVNIRVTSAGKTRQLSALAFMHNLTNEIMHIELNLNVCVTLLSRSQRAIRRVPYHYNSTEEQHRFHYLSGVKWTSCKVTTNGLRKVRDIARNPVHTTWPRALLWMRWFPRDLIPSHSKGQTWEGAGDQGEEYGTQGKREDRYIDSSVVFIWERQRGMLVQLKENSFVGAWTRWDERSEKKRRGDWRMKMKR